MTIKTRVVALAACLTVTVTSLSGCQFLAQQTTPSLPVQTPAPTKSTETAQERQMRTDQEGAMKAYLTSSREADRLAMLGGSTKPTKVLQATTGGAYQEAIMNALKTFRENGWRTDRPSEDAVIADGGWSPGKVGLTACEDSSKVRFLDKKGKEVFKDRDRRYVQTLTATQVDGVWRITDGESKAVKTFEHEGSCSS